MARWEPNARRRLVEAAVELFSEHGYERAGVAEIAVRAGLTKTTFFRHFRDKREVLFAGQEVHGQLLADAIAGVPDGASPIEAVAAGLGALADSFPADSRDFGARLRAIIVANPELHERSALKHASYVETISATLQARGVPSTTAAVAAELGVLAFDTAYGNWTTDTSGSTLPDLVRRTLEETVAAATSIA